MVLASILRILPILVAAPPAAVAEESAGAEDTEPEFRVLPSAWVLGGFVDTNFQGSFNQPNNHVWRGMFSSPRTNEISLNLVALYVRRDAARGDPFHIEIALQAGAAADALHSPEPIAGGADGQFAGPDVWKHIGRANTGLSFDTGTDISGGLFVCPIGLGIFWTPTNWTYSTPWSLNGVPYHLAGGRISQKLGKKFEVQGWVVNGWQTLGDVNKVPSYMVTLNLTPREDLLLQSNSYFGPEAVDSSARAWRTFWNTQLVWTADRGGVAALFDVGRERITEIPGQPTALWMAGAVAGRARILKPHDWFMAWRTGAYWDRDGRMFGVPDNWLLEAVYTNDVHLFDSLLLRLEYRYDRSLGGGYFFRNRATHADAVGLAEDQHTLIFALTGYFEIGLPKLVAKSK